MWQVSGVGGDMPLGGFGAFGICVGERDFYLEGMMKDITFVIHNKHELLRITLNYWLCNRLLLPIYKALDLGPFTKLLRYENTRH